MSRKWAILTLLIAAIAGYVYLPIQEWMAWGIERYQALGAWGAVLFVLSYLLLSLLLIPGSALTITAGLLYGLLWGYMIVALASVGAAAIAFLLARGFFRERVQGWAGRFPHFQAVNDAISRQGAAVTFLVRLSPVFPFSISNYLFGLTRVRFGGYVLASWIGMAPGTVLYVYIGVLGRELADPASQAGPWRWVLMAIGFIATLAVTILVTRLARKALSSKTSGDAVAGTEGA